MVAAPAVAHRNVRPLGADDIERVIEIDRAHSGHSRRRFFEKRFDAAAAQPDDYIHIGVSRAVARCAALPSPASFAASSDTKPRSRFSMRSASRRRSAERGIGQALIEELGAILVRKGVPSLQSQADWTNHDLLRFFDATGFELAPRLALQRPVNELLVESSEEV